MAEGEEGAFFREAWDLRTVQKVAWILAKRSTCRQVSSGFAALPEALKKVAWDGSEDDEAGARGRWAVAWPQQQAAGGAVGGSAAPVVDTGGSAGGAVQAPAAPAPAAPHPDVGALQSRLRAAEEAEQRLHSERDAALRGKAQAEDALRGKDTQLQGVNRTLESKQGEWRQERDEREQTLSELRQQLANAQSTARQQPVTGGVGSEEQQGAVRRVSAGTVTVYTKFDAHDARGGRGFGSINGLLASKPGDHVSVFELYNRLFRGATVGDCLVKRTTGVFLKESEFMDQYRSKLKVELDHRHRVWNSGYHQQLRAFFFA